MKVRVLGCSGAIAKDCRTTSFLLDENVLIDAGTGVGDLTLDVRHCPGHTPGHVVFHHPESKLAIVGDVLFQGSIGRTDFPLGNHQQLLDACAQGAAVLLISEDLDEIFAVADRIAVIHAGRLTAAKPVTEWTLAAIGLAMAGEHSANEAADAH